MTIRQTHTYAELEVSAATFDEIAGKLKAAGYDHAFMEGIHENGTAIDMQGIGLTQPVRSAEPVGSPQERALEAVRAIAAAHGANDGETVDRAVVRMLAVMWADAVRAEWQSFVDADPELKAQHAVGKELMRADGFDVADSICGLPGHKPFVAVVDGKEAVCYDWSMRQVTPLSAIYTDKVRTVQNAAARVAQALKEAAVKAPPEWPIVLANGETFNSIEEMEASPTLGVQEIAKAMRSGVPYGGSRQKTPPERGTTDAAK